jgi:hypothetical protein
MPDVGAFSVPGTKRSFLNALVGEPVYGTGSLQHQG